MPTDKHNAGDPGSIIEQVLPAHKYAYSAFRRQAHSPSRGSLDTPSYGRVFTHMGPFMQKKVSVISL